MKYGTDHQDQCSQRKIVARWHKPGYALVGTIHGGGHDVLCNTKPKICKDFPTRTQFPWTSTEKHLKYCVPASKYTCFMPWENDSICSLKSTQHIASARYRVVQISLLIQFTITERAADVGSLQSVEIIDAMLCHHHTVGNNLPWTPTVLVPDNCRARNPFDQLDNKLQWFSQLSMATLLQIK